VFQLPPVLGPLDVKFDRNWHTAPVAHIRKVRPSPKRDFLHYTPSTRLPQRELTPQQFVPLSGD